MGNMQCDGPYCRKTSGGGKTIWICAFVIGRGSAERMKIGGIKSSMLNSNEIGDIT